MARLPLSLLLVLSVTIQSTWGLILEKPRNLRISGGDTIPIRYAPYMAALFYDDEQCCGATIIDEQFVLTAANCVTSKWYEYINGTDNSEWKVLVGSDQLSTEGIFIEVEDILFHEDYDLFNFDHDICLLKLSENIPFGCFWDVEKIELPEDNRRMYGHDMAVVTGWGVTEHDNRISNELRQARVPVLAKECCSAVHPYVTDDMICAGDKHNSFCMGDAGGPLVSRDGRKEVLIGVASVDAPICGSYPGVYTRVASYLSWIHETMENNR